MTATTTETVAHIAPVLVTGDGREVRGLTIEQRREIRVRLHAYYCWVKDGRPADHFASGVARGINYDRVSIKHHKAAGHYGPGKYSEPEPVDDWIARCDAYLTQLPPPTQAMLYWVVKDRHSLAWVAARFGLSRTTMGEWWRGAITNLYYALGLDR